MLFVKSKIKHKSLVTATLKCDSLLDSTILSSRTDPVNQNLQVNKLTDGSQYIVWEPMFSSSCSSHPQSMRGMRIYQTLLWPSCTKTCCPHAQMRWVKCFCRYWALCPESQAEGLNGILGPAHNCCSPGQTHNAKEFLLDSWSFHRFNRLLPTFGQSLCLSDLTLLTPHFS